MLFSRMTVAARLYAAFGLILAVLVAVTGIAMVKVDRIDKALRANSEIHAQAQRYAINFRGSAHDRSIAIRDVVLSTTQAERDKEIATIAGLADFYAQAALPLEKLISSPEAAPELSTLYTDIQRIEAQAVATTSAIISQVKAGDAAAPHTLWRDAKPQYEEWLAAINKLIDFEENRIQKTNQIAMEEASSFLGAMFIALLLALILSIVVAWLVARSIVRQLGAEPTALAGVARRVAQGELQPVAGAAQAQPGSVLASLGAMRAGLADVVERVRHASEAVIQGTQEIAGGNAGLLQRTEEQAASLQQAASSMEQMTATVSNNADSARQATTLAVEASDTAKKGGSVVAQVASTMDEITESSHKIADIVGVIDSIAFQTNILALNAAVEAARAGQEGRGFAVVASEVRALAQRSASAAKEIKDLIDISMSKVERGSQLVGDAGATMTDIVNRAQRVAEYITEISNATTEQTQGIAQVGQVVTQLDRATRQNAAMVEQSAAAAQALRQQAADLAATVSVFRLAIDSWNQDEPTTTPRLIQANVAATIESAAKPQAPLLEAWGR